MELQRATDNIDQTLSELIAAENDPGKRANLLILHAMALNLSANTMALNALSTEIYDHKKEFKEHREEFRQQTEDQNNLMAQMKGGSKVFMYFIGVIQVVVFGVITWGVTMYSAHVKDFHELEIAVSAYHTKVDALVESHREK